MTTDEILEVLAAAVARAAADAVADPNAITLSDRR